MIKVLVTGANGQLGRELFEIRNSLPDTEFLFVDRSDLDICNPVMVREMITREEPDFVINCAAYTQVDKAEDEARKAFKVNRDALNYLCIACNSVGAILIHISSDYVYDSIVDHALTEEDDRCPSSIYAKSKAEGEEVVRDLCQNWIIIRTSWVYSSYGHNFVKTMLRLGAEHDKLSVVNDQIGAPTYAKDLAQIIVNFIVRIRSIKEKNDLINQFYNFSNEGVTSWDAFARKIFELSAIDCRVEGITTKDYGAKASRPLWSVLSKKKIKSKLGIEIRSWDTALADCLTRLQ